jgi:hypothetical protein
MSPDQMPTEIEEIVDSSMITQRSLSLARRPKSSHPSLSHFGVLMRLLNSIVRVLSRVMNGIRH